MKSNFSTISFPSPAVTFEARFYRKAVEIEGSKKLKQSSRAGISWSYEKFFVLASDIAINERNF